ncbi:MAG: thioredoxin domain-containing protein [bacterium]
MIELPTTMIHWYRKWWGIAIIAVIVIISAFFIVISVLTARYWVMIKKGMGNELYQKFYGSFSQSVSSQAKPIKANRSEIESNQSPFLGSPNANIVIVEYVDFKCPVCKQSAVVMKQLMQKYGYKVKLIARQFPAESIHPNATQLSILALCAHKQNKFWEMHDTLFAKQDSLSDILSESEIKQIASLVGVDYTQLNSCINSQSARIEVDKDYASGISVGVRGTPTFFVNGQKVEGLIDYESWEKIVK